MSDSAGSGERSQDLSRAANAVRAAGPNSPPPMPTVVSNDGREIWDWAASFSRHVHRTNEARRLRSEIAIIGRACGDCDHWMKSRICPREHNVNGQTRGPSMGAAICTAFAEARSATTRRIELTAQLAALNGDVSAEPTPLNLNKTPEDQ